MAVVGVNTGRLRTLFTRAVRNKLKDQVRVV